MLNLRPDEPLANLELLNRLLTENPSLATARIDGTRTLLHVATDWPGHFPNNAATVAALIASGAEVNARFTGQHTETPLHWAASSDDVAVLDALLDHGADIEAPGAVIGGGTPRADAVAFGQWQGGPPPGRARGADHTRCGGPKRRRGTGRVAAQSAKC